MENYLPTLSEPDRVNPSINAYRSLGAFVLLDIDYWQGRSETIIAQYYADILDHLRSGTVFLAVDDERKPIGYATWEVELDAPENIMITRQAAPFGDYLTLQKKLKKFLPQVKFAKAKHPRSARHEQVTW